MSPNQALFTTLLITLQKQYPNMVYDTFLPEEGTPYPFVFIGDSQQIGNYTLKNEINGNITQTIDVWHDNPKKRGTVSTIMEEITNIARNFNGTEEYQMFLVNDDQQIIPDTTTASPLLHGIINLEFRFFKKEEN